MSKMVKLQAIECMAGPSFLIQPGDLFERDAAEAADLVKAKIAVIVENTEEHSEIHHDEKPSRKPRGNR